jgi:hypothetical protein
VKRRYLIVPHFRFISSVTPWRAHQLSMVHKYVEALDASLRVTIVPAEVIGASAAQRSPKPQFVHEEQSDY